MAVFRHGATGRLDAASQYMLDNEFGTHVDEDVIKQILEKGDLKESKVSDQLLFLSTQFGHHDICSGGRVDSDTLTSKH